MTLEQIVYSVIGTLFIILMIIAAIATMCGVECKDHHSKQINNKKPLL